MTYWTIEARQFANCNCDYGCNCQFGGLPDKGRCEAVVGLVIDAGRHGEVDLAGVKAGAIFKWPGAIHEGHGEAIAFIDEAATPEQREAMLKIMAGQDTDPMATHFAVFASTVETMHEPQVVAIDFDVDVEGRTGHLRVPGHVEMRGEPIRSPATGEPVRARIHIPDGFEYEYADIGSGSSRGEGPVPIELTDSYGQFCHLHLDSHGVVHG
ncbi:DUF1326 domain-containing protein [Sphingomicrobium astaxanthinifaciens]|uniref:DUF1326 domain-containing protein n=1 Tax=Sphingomicrobium astaxanthinifaciens TaxID=1227949 RepID=UPI001FCC468E|nr:DUF1326 domain-containing protein [Sphingomicrobium astaxanthinifaciens]MCJ7421909.1 DUF1326 domain-containing protein [Sphingomicrobium astaxanthinifaciens]